MYSLTHGHKTGPGKMIRDPHFSLENALFTKAIKEQWVSF